MKRSNSSPENSSRKSKILKVDYEEENVSNEKENFETELIMVKHCLTTTTNDDNDEDPTDLSSWSHFHPLWTNLLQKTFDPTYKCHSNYLDAHPAITTKMRSVLCDWLIEVSEVYHLHRETYHLAIAYVDQYLCNTSQLIKTKLQLLGITSLFIAAKIEEIYPPRISEFAYVTDKAYSELDILEMELDIMKVLNWNINPITTISWLLIYLQVENDLDVSNRSSTPTSITNNLTPSHHDRSKKKRRLSSTNSSSKPMEKEILKTSVLSQIHRSPTFVQTFSLAVRLIDLCSLDIEFCQFPKNVLAATAILACRPDWPIERITALNDDDLYVCNEWIKPFFDVLYFGENLRSIPLPASRSAAGVPIDELYSIQIHNISLEFLENVYKKRPKFVPPSSQNRPFRNLVNRLSWLPTPPTSLEKQQHETIITEEETLQITELVTIS